MKAPIAQPPALLSKTPGCAFLFSGASIGKNKFTATRISPGAKYTQIVLQTDPKEQPLVPTVGRVLVRVRVQEQGNRFARDDKEPGPQLGAKQLPGEQPRESAET